MDTSAILSTSAWFLLPFTTACLSYFAFTKYFRDKKVTVTLPPSDPSSFPYPRYRHVKGQTELIQRPNFEASLSYFKSMSPSMTASISSTSTVTCSALNTVLDIFTLASQLYPDRLALGSRPLIRLHTEEKWVTKVVGTEEIKEKKTWQYFEKGEYTWMTYKEIYSKALALGSALRKWVDPGKMFCLYSNTSAEWQLLAQGCFSQSITIVTAYDTLGLDGLLYSLKETQVNGIFLTVDLLPNFVPLVSQLPHLKLIVYLGEAPSSSLDQLSKDSPHVTTASYTHLLELGDTNKLPLTPPQPKDLACIMYTSGSTGTPKGVMLTHSNLVSGVGGVEATLRPLLTPTDVYLAFLPLAHVLEFMVEIVCFYAGIAIGYGSPKTLVDSSMRNCFGDIRTLRPTIMAGVPAVWDAVRKGILNKLNQQSKFVRAIFHSAYHLKSFCYKYHIPFLSWLPDKLVFRKIRQQTGGRLRLALSGGAPLSEDTQYFLTMVLCRLYLGYGLTESGGICILFDPAVPFVISQIGPPVPSTELMLVPVETYPNQPNVGELWIRGPNITSGYFDQPEVTSQVFHSDGWFQTGDIAMMLPNGTFRIIDRVKNLVKLLNGEYLALEKLESVYATCVYVQRMCLYADARANFPIALVVPSPAPLFALATSLGLDSTNLEMDTLCQSSKLQQAILQELQSLWKKKGGLANYEKVHGVVLCCEDWTPQNQLLTAAMKLKRREIYAKFRSEIDRFYVST